MNRAGITLSAVLATIGVTKILFPAAIASLFALDSAVAMFALATAVLAYGVWFGPLKFLSGNKTFQVFGLSIFMAGLASISSPTLWGFRESFVPIADIFLVIEVGILIQLIGLEKKQVVSITPLSYATLGWQAIQRRLHPGRPVASTTTSISH